MKREQPKLFNFSYFSLISGHVGECQRAVLVLRRTQVQRGLDGRVAVRRVPLFHLHGEAAERAPLPALLQALLLPLHPEVAHGAAVAVPPLQVSKVDVLFVILALTLEAYVK